MMQNFYRSIVGCEIAGHLPDRRRVSSKDGDFRTKCKHCNAPLARYGHEDWREDVAV